MRPRKERLAKIEKELAEMKTESAIAQAQWQADQETIKKQRELRAQIEQVKQEIEQAERAYDLNKAAELKYGKLTALEKQLRRSRVQAKTHCCSRKKSTKRISRRW